MPSLLLFLAAACLLAASAHGQSAPDSATASSSNQTDVAAILQIEDEWLKTERHTDLATLERIMADDFAGVGSNGLAPGKAQLVKNLQVHEGQTPPYTVETSDMHIIVRGDTAVATYAKTYTANALKPIVSRS